MKKLRTDFRFGFEFEGFARLNSYVNYEELNCEPDDNFDNLPCNCLDGDDYEYFYKKINNFINNKLKVINGRTHYDGSVKNYLNGYQSFEYSSIVYKFNAKNLYNLNKFFSKLDEYDMGINETCGFHTHISYKGINENDVLWITCQIAENENWIKEVTSFDDGEYHTNFYNSRYAEKEYLRAIKNAIDTKNFDYLSKLLNNEKYRVLRLHPQGTIEWRGPRNFLNIDNGWIKFSKKLTKVIDIFRNALDTNSICGMDRKTFFSNFIADDTYFLNGFYMPKNHKTLARQNVVGCLGCFSASNENNLTKNISKIVNAFRFNNNLFFNEDLKMLKNYFIDGLNYTEIDNFVNFVIKNNKNLESDIAIRISINNSSCFNLVEKFITDYISSTFVGYMIDSRSFKNQTNEFIEKFIRNIFKHTYKSDYPMIIKSLLRRVNYAKNVIKSMINEGFFKDINLTSALTLEFFSKDEINELSNKTIICEAQMSDLSSVFSFVNLVQDVNEVYTNYLYPIEHETVECAEDVIEEIRPVEVALTTNF